MDDSVIQGPLMKSKYPLLSENVPELARIKRKIRQARIKSVFFSIPFLIPILIAYIPLHPKLLWAFVLMSFFCFTLIYQIVLALWFGKDCVKYIEKVFKANPDLEPRQDYFKPNALNDYIPGIAYKPIFRRYNSAPHDF